MTVLTITVTLDAGDVNAGHSLVGEVTFEELARMVAAGRQVADSLPETIANIVLRLSGEDEKEAFRKYTEQAYKEGKFEGGTQIVDKSMENPNERESRQ